jgi:hypothetical protein
VRRLPQHGPIVIQTVASDPCWTTDVRRTVSLPAADENDIAASSHDGIRQVRVGIKVEKAEAKRSSIAKTWR